MPRPLISVIVATRDRSDYLRLCLQALTRQTLPPEAFEILVVDNGSSDDTGEVLRDFRRSMPNLHLVREERAGLSRARNAGVQASTAELVAFTDDDAVPAPDWAERISARYAQLGAEVAVLGGEVNPIWEAPRPEWLTNTLLRPLSAGLLWSPTARILRGDEWLMEVNIAYRKSRLLEFGGFSEDLGRIGDSLLSGEGCINLIMIRAGLKLFYDPEILVGHHIPASRLTRTWFRRRYFWQGVSMNRVYKYVERVSVDMKIPPAQEARSNWEEITVPTSAHAWADLFDDRSPTPFEDQVYMLEQLGYLLESQSLISGR